MINVLVVEDDPMVAQLHEHYLSQIKGFQLCDVANNGDMALKLLSKKNYDLLILHLPFYKVIHQWKLDIKMLVALFLYRQVYVP